VEKFNKAKLYALGTLSILAIFLTHLDAVAKRPSERLSEEDRNYIRNSRIDFNPCQSVSVAVTNYIQSNPDARTPFDSTCLHLLEELSLSSKCYKGSGEVAYSRNIKRGGQFIQALDGSFHIESDQLTSVSCHYR